MSKSNKAIFLDRDGVINKEKSTYVKTVSELEIFSGIANSIKKLKDAGFLVIVITNQSAVNRGLTNHDNVNYIHFNIQEYLRKNGTFIDKFYYCPHRPDENCSCRKPKPGLLLKAAGELNIDLNSSWMIGDSDSDIEAAKSAGCKSIKINSDISFTSAVKIILDLIDF
jgi:D-glycero-D-manno-heptose 1,7-bisphosphate phosphatase